MTTTKAPAPVVVPFAGLIPDHLLNGCPVAALLAQAMRVLMRDDGKSRSLGHAIEIAAEELGSDARTLEVAYAFVPEARRTKVPKGPLPRHLLDVIVGAFGAADRLGNGDLSKHYKLA